MHVHGFKSQEIARLLVEVGEERKLLPIRDESSPPQTGFKALPRQYWVVPKGTIPAATDRVTPGRGEAYILKLDREAGTPTLARHQSGGADVEVIVWNYQQNTIVESSELEPILRATEDTFGELSIVNEGMVGLLFEQVGGTAGTNLVACSFTYDVSDLYGNSLLSGVDPTSSPHLFNRHGVGECIAAESGSGYHNGTAWVILDCTEKLATGAC
jgi:hypothetical protein